MHCLSVDQEQLGAVACALPEHLVSVEIILLKVGYSGMKLTISTSLCHIFQKGFVSNLGHILSHFSQLLCLWVVFKSPRVEEGVIY